MPRALKQAELGPMAVWMDQSRTQLVALSAATAWPSLHTDVLPTFGQDHAASLTFELFAGPAAIFLFDLAHVLRCEPDRAERELQQLAMSLVPMADVPPFDLAVSRAKREPPDQQASALATSLLHGARAAALAIAVALASVDASRPVVGDIS